jgi:hypothetical protein
MRMFRYWFLLFLLAFLGCQGGGEAPPPITVTGQVTVDSKPVTEGTIYFKVDDRSTETALLDTAGTYSIQVHPGEAKVWFETGLAGADDDPAAAPPVEIPEKYTSEASGLTYTVTGDAEQKKDFALSRK